MGKITDNLKAAEALWKAIDKDSIEFLARLQSLSMSVEQHARFAGEGIDQIYLHVNVWLKKEGHKYNDCLWMKLGEVRADDRYIATAMGSVDEALKNALKESKAWHTVMDREGKKVLADIKRLLESLDGVEAQIKAKGAKLFPNKTKLAAHAATLKGLQDSAKKLSNLIKFDVLGSKEPPGERQLTRRLTIANSTTLEDLKTLTSKAPDVALEAAESAKDVKQAHGRRRALDLSKQVRDIQDLLKEMKQAEKNP